LDNDNDPACAAAVVVGGASVARSADDAGAIEARRLGSDALVLATCCTEMADRAGPTVEVPPASRVCM
jgi:hypothetical protein